MNTEEEKRKNRYKSIGATIIGVAFVICIMVFIMIRFSDVWKGFLKLVNVLTPFFIGINLCYLVNPIYALIRSSIIKLTKKESVAKFIASFAVVILVLVFIYAFGTLLIPSLIESAKSLYAKTPEIAVRFQSWFDSLSAGEFLFKEEIMQIAEKGIDYFGEFTINTIMPNIDKIASTLYTSVVSVAGALYDGVIGIVAMVYLLNCKEKLIPSAKRIIYAATPKHAVEICTKTSKFSEIFGGFIRGKLFDSLIVGILCFIAMSVFRMPYALLISFIIGITNIIPFFGPFIGAVPSSFIILIIDPGKGIGFILMILILQQIDGNLIGPKILGNSIGISSLSVLFSIIVGGGLFGFTGMLLAVPTWAFVQYMIEERVRERLKKAGLPDKTEEYRIDVPESSVSETKTPEPEVQNESDEVPELRTDTVSKDIEKKESRE